MRFPPRPFARLPVDPKPLDILRERPTSASLKTYAVAYMATKTNSFEYTRNVLAKLNQQARDEVAKLGGNPGVEKKIGRASCRERVS